MSIVSGSSMYMYASQLRLFAGSSSDRCMNQVHRSSPFPFILLTESRPIIVPHIERKGHSILGRLCGPRSPADSALREIA